MLYYDEEFIGEYRKAYGKFIIICNMQYSMYNVIFMSTYKPKTEMEYAFHFTSLSLSLHPGKEGQFVSFSPKSLQ